MWKELNEVINLPCPQACPACEAPEPAVKSMPDPGGFSPHAPKSGDREVTQFTEQVHPTRGKALTPALLPAAPRGLARRILLSFLVFWSS